jgi:hypothetical protein
MRFTSGINPLANNLISILRESIHAEKQQKEHCKT